MDYRRTSIVPFIIFIVSGLNLAGQDVLLRTQSEINAFNPATTYIVGNLSLESLSSDPITDISNLSNIEYIGGSLTIESTRIPDVDAFSKLDSIGGELSLSFNTELVNIDGFSNLHHVGSEVYIYYHAKLTSISGLSGLDHVHGRLEMKKNDALQSLDGLQNISAVDGYLSVTDNIVLRDVESLSGITQVAQHVTIKDNDSLKIVNCFPALMTVGGNLTIQGLALSGSPGLLNLQTVGGNFNISSTSFTDIDAPNLISVGGSFTIGGNALITDIPGFSNLVRTGDMGIGGNGLIHLSGFANLVETDSLDFTSNSKLIDIKGFNQLTTINGELFFFRNTVLKEIDGLSKVRSVHTLEVYEGNGLKHLAGLSGLRVLKADLFLLDTYLTTLQGLSNVDSIGGVLHIWKCNSLTRVDAFSKLTKVGGEVSISQNDKLVGVDSMLNIDTIFGNLDISSNPLLNNVDGLSGLSRVNGNLAISNTLLGNVNGLHNLISVGGSMNVGGTGLTNVHGLSKLTTVGGDLTLGLYYVPEIDSLYHLTSVGGELRIFSSSLRQVDGFRNLESIGSLDFHNNNLLNNVDGFKKLKHVGGNFSLKNNAVLDHCCALQTIMENPTMIDGNIYISNNGSNCSSITEIINATNCGTLNVYNDLNANCTRETSEPGLSNRLVLVDPGSYIFITDYLGRADIASLPFGSYTIRVDTSGPWFTDCSIVRDFEYITQDSFPEIESFPLTSTEPCSHPSVTIEMPLARRCTGNQKIYIQVCNDLLATGAILDGFLDLTLDSILTLQSASVPYEQLDEHKFRFNLGDLSPGQCKKITALVMVSCQAALGQTLCISSELYPVDTCVFDNTVNTFSIFPVDCEQAYEGSDIDVAGVCEGDSIRFTVRNHADHEVGCYTPVRLFANTELLWNDSIWLAAQGETTFTIPADGKTYRMEADQHPGHPGLSRPNVTVERCGDLGNWTPGLTNAFYLDDASPLVDIFCTEIIGSVDPNDKRGYPLGITDDHLVLPGQPLEYTIRFQNTGNDTAFTVIILDTLDTDLDIFSVVPGVTSHPASFRMFGQRVLEWTFNNILLPDSTINEVESHGFVTFQVNQNPHLPNGTSITNEAAIYFDFNEAVITNTTFHEINNQIQGIISSVQPEKAVSAIHVYPNPTSGPVYIRSGKEYSKMIVDVWNVTGEAIYQNIESANDQLQLEFEHDGVYFVRVSIGNRVETLKVIVNR